MARTWITCIVTVISVGTLVGLFVLATLPALVGLATAATGVRGNNPYRTLNRAMLVVCALGHHGLGTTVPASGLRWRYNADHHPRRRGSLTQASPWHSHAYPLPTILPAVSYDLFSGGHSR